MPAKHKAKPNPRNRTGTRGYIDPRPERPIESMGSYTFEEAAAYLQISKRSLRRLVDAGVIGFLKINQRQRRILGRQILDYMDRRAQGPTR